MLRLSCELLQYKNKIARQSSESFVGAINWSVEGPSTDHHHHLCQFDRISMTPQHRHYLINLFDGQILCVGMKICYKSNVVQEV